MDGGRCAALKKTYEGVLDEVLHVGQRDEHEGGKERRTEAGPRPKILGQQRKLEQRMRNEKRRE